MKRFRFLKWVLVPAGALVIMVAALWLQPSLLQAPLESFVSKQTGREFQIAGEFKLEFGKELRLQATQIQFANAAWADLPTMLRIGVLKVRLLTSSIFNGPLQIISLDISDIDLNLLENEDGKQNWLLEMEAEDSTEKSDNLFMVNSIKIGSASILYSSPDIKRDVIAQIDHFEQLHLDDDMLEISLSGNINNSPLEFHGTLGPFQNLIDASHISIEGTGMVGRLEFSGSGVIDSLKAPEQPSFKLEIKGPEINDITQLLGLEDLGGGDFILSAEMAPGDERNRVSLKGHIGDSFINLDGAVTNLKTFSGLNVDIHINGPSLGSFTRLLKLGDWPKEPFSIEGSITREASKLIIPSLALHIADTTFDLAADMNRFPSLGDSVVNLRIKGKDVAKFRELLNISGAATGPFDISAKLDVSDAGIELLEVTGTTSMGIFQITGNIEVGSGYVGSELHIKSSGANIHQLTEAYGIHGFPAVPFDLDTRFTVQENGIMFQRGKLVTINEDLLEIEGMVSFTPLERDTDIRFRVTGDDISEFTPIVGPSIPIPRQAYDIGGRFRATSEGFLLDDIVGKIASVRVKASGLVTRDKGLVGSKLDLALEGPELGELLRDPKRYNLPEGAFKLAGHLEILDRTFKLEQVQYDGPLFRATGNLVLSHPLQNGSGTFEINIAGQNIHPLFPAIGNFQIAPLPFKISARGQMSHGTITFDDMSANAGELSLNWKGVVDLPPNMSDTHLIFEAITPDLAELGELGGQTLPAGPFKISARFSGSVDEFSMDDLDLQFIENHISGEMSISLKEEIPRVDFALSSEFLDVSPIYDDMASDLVPTRERLINDRPFPVDSLVKVNGNFRVDIKELRFKHYSLHNIDLDASLENGELLVQNLRGNGQHGDFGVVVSLVPMTGGRANFNASIKSDGLILNIMQQSSENVNKLPPVNIEVELHGQGADLQQLAGTLNGNILVTSPGGEVNDFDVGVLNSFLFKNISSIIIPSNKVPDQLKLECLVASFGLVNGLVVPEPGLFIKTDMIELEANGTIDLNTEALDINFKITAGKAYKTSIGELLHPYFKLVGTLSKPSITLDVKSALLQGGAAVGTAGLSILFKVAMDRVKGIGKNPCVEFLDRAA